MPTDDKPLKPFYNLLYRSIKHYNLLKNTAWPVMCHNLWARRQVSHQKSWIKQDLASSKSTDITSLLFILTSMRRGFSERADIGSVHNVPWRSSLLHLKHGRVFNLSMLYHSFQKHFRVASDRDKKKRVHLMQSCCIMMFCQVISKLMIWVWCQRQENKTRHRYRRVMSQVWSSAWTRPVHNYKTDIRDEIFITAPYSLHTL